jgi:preprotein translocase subunit YajC
MSATIIIVLILLVAGVYFLVKQEQHVRALKAEEQQAQLPANS